VNGLSISGGNSGNYTLSSSSAQANIGIITQATPTVLATGGTFVYDGNPHSGTGTATGVLTPTDNLSPVNLSYEGTGVTIYGPTTTAPKNAGSYTLTASFTGNTNYAPATNTASLVIEKRPITITADPKTKAFGESDPAFTAQITSGNIISPDVASGSLTRVAGENAGTYTINKGTYTYGANYAEAYISANLTIGQNVATITLSNLNQTYTSSPLAVTASTNPAGLSGLSITYNGSSTIPTNAGTYAVVASLTNPKHTSVNATDNLVI